MISKRISDIFCSKEVFEKAASVYNEALLEARYISKTESTTTNKKIRSRNIWFKEESYTAPWKEDA